MALVDPTGQPRSAHPWPPFRWLLAAALVIGASAWLRLHWIEPLAWSAHCASNPDQWLCAARSSMVMLIQHERLGWIALSGMALALFTRWRWLFVTAFLLGAASLMLYSVEPGAVATLVGSLVLLRQSPSGRRASSG